MIHMQDSSLYPLYSLYQIGGTVAYIAGAILIAYCTSKLYSAIERHRISKRRDKNSKLVTDIDEIGNDPDWGNDMYKKIKWIWI